MREQSMDKKVAKEVKRLTKFYGERIHAPMTREYNLVDPEQRFRAYLDGNDPDAFLFLKSSCEALSDRWHLLHYEAIALNEGRLDLEHFALAARYAGWVVRFSEAMLPNHGSGLLPYDAAAYLSLAIIAGWRDEADQLARILFNGLDTQLLHANLNDKQGWTRGHRHFWFVLQLFADLKGWPVDITKYWHPKDMEPYVGVLRNWRTTDLEQVTAMVHAMADFHVAESNDEKNKESSEFTADTYRLFPHEIHAFLCLRQWQGLSSPDHYDHPLMQQPLGKVPNEVPVPDTPLLDQVIEKFKAEYPATFADK